MKVLPVNSCISDLDRKDESEYWNSGVREGAVMGVGGGMKERLVGKIWVVV